jgi:hypothetical protein
MGYTGGDRSEFGIIDIFDSMKDYTNIYEPKKYDCIAICEEALNDWYPLLQKMPTYHGRYSCPAFNIARYAVTLIPPTSLDLLINAIKSSTKAEFREDSLEIVDLLEKAKMKNRYVILYDV